MEVSNYKMKFTNSRDNNYLQMESLTYHKKLKNEIESIPKVHKKFFRNALNKYTFDMEVYIPNLSEKNRKPHPNKNYLINKLIKYEKFTNLNRFLLEKNSKESTKFTKDYNYIKENNIRQKDYINNLLEIYKDKKYEINELKYSKKENIFNNSILLDHKLGENTTQDVLKYGNNEQNRKNFINDNQLIIKFNDVIQESRSPNAKIRNKNKCNKFKYNINDFIKGNQINTNINNDINETTKKKPKNKKENKLKKRQIKKEQNFISDEKDINLKKDVSIISDKLNKINNNINNKEKVDEINISKSKIDNTITTYYGNDSFIFNESKNSENNNNQNTINIKSNIFEEKNKNDDKIRYINNSKNNLKKNKYLLTTLNKIKIKKENTEINSNDINDNKMLIFSKERTSNNKNMYKSKDNLYINLPGIQHSTSFKKLINYTFENKNNSKNINRLKKIKLNDNSIQKNIKNLKETFGNKYNKSELEKRKEKEINNLYSTINYNSKFFREYPFDQVENYFLKHKKIKIGKIKTNKGSNILPILEGIENIVKDKELYKLVRALNETKKIIYLRSTGTLENFDKAKNIDSEKIKDYDDKIPLLKYDFAENILCDNENFEKNKK